MNDFVDDPSCEKCGAFQPMMRYCPRRSVQEAGVFGSKGASVLPEFLACVCRRCEWDWKMKPKQAAAGHLVEKVNK